MNYDQPYDGRRPSFGQTRHGEQFIRGFRSRPGAPMHDPTSNVPISQDRMTPQSNWDSMFRNTASNAFGAAGQNPSYQSSFPAPGSTPAPPGSLVQGIMDDEAFGGGASPFSGPSNHAQEWSQPARKPSLLGSNGWQITGKAQQQDILNKYKPKTNNGFGWGSAFEQT